MQYQGVDTSGDRNVTALRMGAGNAANKVEDKAIADTYGRQFYVPLDFEALSTHAPFYQSALGDHLKYELTFNSHGRVINSTSPATYTINNICLEFDMVTQPELARQIEKSMKDVLILFEEPSHNFERDTEAFYNRRYQKWR